MAISGQFVLSKIEEVKAGHMLLLNGLNKDHFVLRTVKWAGYVYWPSIEDEVFTVKFQDDTDITSRKVRTVRIFEED